ncbi:MAG: hypothetical protein IKA90_06940 [Clostridia bacterium]|nr:hypothetical protein [Clostridia bacterium]
MTKKTKKKTRGTVALVVLAILSVLVLSYFAVFTNGFTTDFKDFFVKVDNDFIINNGSGYIVSSDKSLNIKTLSALGFLEKSVVDDCNVSIKANESIKFDYYVDGNLVSFNNDVDWSKAFEIKKNKVGFSIKSKVDTLEELFYIIHGTDAVRFLDTDYRINNMFILTITKDETELNLYFCVSDVEIQIEFESEEIIF